MNGKIAVVVTVLSALIVGVGVWYTQVYAFYQPVAFQPGAEIRLTPIISRVPEPILAENVTGIDADSSPLRFRACFTTPLSVAMLSETYVIYDLAVPLTAPGWFDCFDAQVIGRALETGEAIAFLSEPEIAPGVDRVVAVFPDGRAFAWHQINASLKE